MITGRLSRLNAAGAETVLIEDFLPAVPEPLRGLDRLRTGRDALRKSSGDGASFNFADYGQDGSP